MMIYMAWNRQVFNQQVGSQVEVMQEIKREINDKKLAYGGPELSFDSNI
jgi:hypothetical protein